MPNTIELPPKYYLDHFLEFRNSLLFQYGAFFRPVHHAFFQDFDGLSEDAKCLYLRFVNRKGRFFFRETLIYKEINDVDSCLSELNEKKFTRSVSENDWTDLLAFLPKGKLLALSHKRGLESKKSWAREKFVEQLGSASFELLPEIIVQDRISELTYLMFLFFGKIQDNLALYTLRDLGVRKTNKEKSNFRPRFSSIEDAESHYFYATLAENVLNHTPIETWPPAMNPECLSLREEILLSLADHHRKNQDFILSLEVLKNAEAHPGREKRARLYYQLDMKEECLKELNQILETPYTDSEYLFAEDFLARKFQGRPRSILTETLRNARKISIDESYFRHPEQGVQNYFKERDVTSLHVENYIWNALFGILFWEELFESDKTALFNEFERVPKDLYSNQFYELHEAEILEKLVALNLTDILLKLESKKEIPNGVYGYSDLLPAEIELFLSHADLNSVRNILIHMAKDYKKRSTGYPDLLAIENGKVKFYEIKAPGDVLKESQLLQMIALQRAGFEVEVLQVEYAFNPNQLYVVVDIETTGGSSPYHRITELGAVKFRNGEIIERYQTLVNPQRVISREIQQLTGITNEMVKSAPKFSDVMDAFDAFTKDAIFVAHNVNFDYGFIQAEFERCDRRFVRPFICTKVSMKKHYPGLESYSLKNLTSRFNISLETHHRALCDAEAAAGLLLLINKKRAEAS